MIKGSTNPSASVHVKARNFPLTEGLRQQVIHKMGRLEKYLDRLRDLEVILWTEPTREAEHHNHVEATARVAGRTVHVTTCSSDMYAALDEAVDKLYRQLNRTKERMKSHHARGIADTVEEAPVLENEEPDEIVRVKRFALEPEFEDEAIATMETLGHSFYVFLNARNEQINVLYRRKDGTLGLIEPAR